MPDSVTLDLPWPPSVNHYWMRNRFGGMRIGKNGEDFQKAVMKICAGVKGVEGRVSVYIEAMPPDKRKRDLDNICKALLDSLGHAKIIEDDCKIDDLQIRRRDPVAGGAIKVRVMRIWA